MARRKITKQSKRRIFLFGTVSIFVIGYFVFSLSYYAINIYNLKKEEKELSSNLEELKHDEKLLKTEIEKLNDKDYLARYARENYAYSKDGELILKIEKNKENKVEDEDFKIDLTNDNFIFIGIFILILIIVHILKRTKRKKS